MSHIPADSVRKPYFKLPKDPRAAAATSWNVPDLCAAYNWPTGEPGGGVRSRSWSWAADGSRRTSTRSFQSLGQPKPSIDRRFRGRHRRTRRARADRRATTTTRSRSTSRFPERRITRPRAKRQQFASTGRRISAPQSRKPHPTAAMCAPSPGAPTKPTGARRPPSRWTRPCRPPWPEAWLCLPRRATTTPATAAQRRPMSIAHRRARTWWAAAEPTRQRRRRRCGTTTPAKPTAREPAGATRRSSPCRVSRSARRPRPPTRSTARAEWCRMCAPTPTPTPATTSYVHGSATVVGGTSAVAPLYAGLFAALRNQARLRHANALEKSEGLQRHHRRRQRILQRGRGPGPMQRHRIADRNEQSLRSLPHWREFLTCGLDGRERAASTGGIASIG